MWFSGFLLPQSSDTRPEHPRTSSARRFLPLAAMARNQDAEPREGIEPSFHPYQGCVLPLNDRGLSVCAGGLYSRVSGVVQSTFVSHSQVLSPSLAGVVVQTSARRWWSRWESNPPRSACKTVLVTRLLDPIMLLHSLARSDHSPVAGCSPDGPGGGCRCGPCLPPTSG